MLKHDFRSLKRILGKNYLLNRQLLAGDGSVYRIYPEGVQKN